MHKTIARSLVPIAITLAMSGGMALAATQTADAASAVRISTIMVDPSGTDYRVNSQINREYIVIKNFSSKSKSLSGYKIKDKVGKTYTFPKGFKLGAHKSVTLKTGKGKSTSATRYWNATNYIWNNTTDTAKLYSSKGTRLDTCSYRSSTLKRNKSGSKYASC